MHRLVTREQRPNASVSPQLRQPVNKSMSTWHRNLTNWRGQLSPLQSDIPYNVTESVNIHTLIYQHHNQAGHNPHHTSPIQLTVIAQQKFLVICAREGNNRMGMNPRTSRLDTDHNHVAHCSTWDNVCCSLPLVASRGHSWIQCPCQQHEIRQKRHRWLSACWSLQLSCRQGEVDGQHLGMTEIQIYRHWHKSKHRCWMFNHFVQLGFYCLFVSVSTLCCDNYHVIAKQMGTMSRHTYIFMYFKH